MKNISSLLLLSLFSCNLFSQEIPEREIKTDVNEVTVFIEGAQITRKKIIDLTQGVSILKFTGLSPFIDAKSIQVKANGNVTVLSVNHQQDYIDILKKPKELTDLELKLEIIENKLKLESTYLDIITEELAFLKDNRDISDNLKEINLITLKEASTFYSTNLKALKLSGIEHEKSIADLIVQRNNYENQMKTITSKEEYPSGQILVKVSSKNPSQVNFEISYLVNNASWFPSYDIRAKNINNPIELIYKANVRQDTKEEWKNVRMKFSSSDPNKTGVAPELRTYLLNYNSLPPVYNRITGNVNGKVTDSETRETLPGATVTFEGTTIGTITDAGGNYSITVPNNAGNLVFSYIGYVTERIAVSGPTMNVQLVPDIVSLEEVVVTGYGTQKKDVTAALQGRIAGVQVQNAGNIRIRGINSTPVPLQMVEKQTTVDFEIKTPYTVLSDNKSYSVDLAVYSLPANYQYYCVPKIDRDAFLIAHIVEWEKYNLLEAEANIFFEDTYVGKSLLDVRYATDTLKISLGRDKNVSVTREKARELTTKQFIGNKKEDIRDWLTTVKNNKSQKINMMVIDQVPVSTLEEIEIELQKTSGAKLNIETGEIKWEFSLEPMEKKEFELKYSVKYPKYQNLIVE